MPSCTTNVANTTAAPASHCCVTCADVTTAAAVLYHRARFSNIQALHVFN
jgi:hypothetical protein